MNTKMKVATSTLVVIILAVVFGFYFLKQKLIADRVAAYSPPPVAVTTLQAEQSRWRTRIAAIGQVTADAGVDVTPQLGGQVRSIHFHSGDQVQAGDLLVQLDDALEQDELTRDKAKAKLSKLDVERYTKLVREKSASQSTLDRAEVTYQSDQAQAHATQTKIDYLAIKAPFSGKLGIRKVNVGDYVQPGTPLVNLQDISRLYVDFSVPEAKLPLLKPGLSVEVHSEANPAAKYTAQIMAVSAQVDPNSRNVDVRALLSQDDDGLSPGMYVDVSVITDQVSQVVVLPAVAVSYSLYGDTVYVVGKSQAGSDGSGAVQQFAVEPRSVQIWAKAGARVALSDGVKSGDQVITSNQHQLKKDARITINNDTVLDPNSVGGQ